MANNHTRRTALAAIAAAPVAALALPAVAQTADNEQSASFDDGVEQGRELALCEMARAWIDRYRACGGEFAMHYSGNGVARITPMPYTWTPTDKGNPRLHASMWLCEEAHHEGAVKVLEAMLELVPGLRQTVRDIAMAQVLAASAREA